MSHGGLQSGNPPAEVPVENKGGRTKMAMAAARTSSRQKPNFIYGVFGM